MVEIKSEGSALSSKYRKFLVTGIFRTIITRVLSIIYIIAITDFVPLPTQDLMIIIATSQYLIIQTTLFGIAYALTQRGISRNFSESTFLGVAFTTSLVGLPVSILSSIVLSYYLNLSLTNSLLLIVSTSLNYTIEIMVILNNCLIKSDIGLLIRTIYSILNSILVPSLFIFYEELSSILLAWIIASIVSLIFVRKLIYKLITQSKILIYEGWDIFKFGFPIYLAALFYNIAQRIDSFILYELFEDGETAKYYWVARLAVLSEEFFLNVLTGILPLMTKYYSSQTLKVFRKLVGSIIRLTLIGAVIFYTSIIFNSQLLIFIILGNEFLENAILLKIILIGATIGIIATILNTGFSAEGNRKLLIYGYIANTVTKLLPLLLLYSYGALGLSLSRMINRILITTIYVYFGWNKYIKNEKSKYFRIVIFASLWIFISFTIGIEITAISAIVSNILYFILLLLSMILIKPLPQSDIVIIEKVFGRRFKYFKKLTELISY